MAKPGSEAAHEEKLRQLAGPDAEWVFQAPRKYPPLDATAIDKHLTANPGVVCAVQETTMRAVIYRHEGTVHALVTDLVQGGYRRRHRKVEAASTEELVAAMKAGAVTF